MFRVGEHMIMTDPESVILTLQTQLHMNKIFKLSKVKKSGSNLQVTCPVHNEGMESKPSCGVTMVDKPKAKAGTAHCFTCGYSANLETFISNCFNVFDDGRYGRDWLVKNFLSVSIESRGDLSLDFTRHSKTQDKKERFISESILQQYRYYHDYMYERGLTDELIELFDVGYDPNFLFDTNNKKTVAETLTFPVRDELGRTLFVARRGIYTKFYHYPPNIVKPLYGIYEVGEIRESDEIVICESFINTITATKYGDKSLALLGTGNPEQYTRLRQLPARKYITAFDGDEAGRRATERFKRALSPYKIVTSLQVPEGKDINDLSYEEYLQLPELF